MGEAINKGAFGKRINTLRKEKGLTGDALSERIGLQPVSLRQIEGGKHLPSLPAFVRICNSLETSADYFLSEYYTFSDDDQRKMLIAKIKTLSPSEIRILIALADALNENHE